MTQAQRKAAEQRREHASDALVDARDGQLCVRCGNSTVGGWWSRQHRLARGMGGSTNDPVVSSAANKITLCGSATTGCHFFVESYRTTALDYGWSLVRGQDPASVRVLYRGRWVLLDDSGGIAPAEGNAA